jgi:hypothetical protein
MRSIMPSIYVLTNPSIAIPVVAGARGKRDRIYYFPRLLTNCAARSKSNLATKLNSVEI